MSRARVALGVILAVGALLTLSSCEWLYSLFGDPPVAILVVDPTAGDAPLDVAFDVSGSIAAGGVQRFRIDFGDGSEFAAGTQLDEPIAHTYAAPGTYTAVLELTDDNGRADHDTEEIVVGEGAEPETPGPIALLAANTTLGDVPLAVTFDVSLSSAPDSTLVSFRLDFGDGTPPTIGTNFSQSIVHLYVGTGLHTATLLVHDANGATGTATLDIVATIEGSDNGPTAVLAADPTFGDIPLAVSFDVSGSSSLDSALASFRLDFGDGTPLHEATDFSPPIAHVYVGIGLHTATLTVTDADGATGVATLGIVATAAGENPIARFEWTPEDPFIDEVVTFDAGASTDPAGGIVKPRAIVVYTWDFGDGAEAATTTETVDHAYTWPGTYTVTLTIYDDDGVAGTATDEITVRGVIAYVTHPWSGGGTASEIRFPARDTSRAINTSIHLTFDVAISTNGAFVYVAGVDFGAIALTLTKLRTSDLTVVAEADLAVEAISLAVHPDGGELYATPGGTLGDEVWVIDPSTLAVVGTIPVQSGSNVVAFTPSGDFAYVTCTGAQAVLKIDTATRTVVDTIDLGEGPWGIAIHPDGGTAYVTTSGDHVLVLDLSVSPTGIEATIDVGGNPAGVAFTHDGEYAYVANSDDGTVSVIDASDRTVIKTIALDDPFIDPPEPADIAISPGDTVAVVPHGIETTWPNILDEAMYVSVIDLATNTVIEQLSLGVGPASVDIWGIGY